MSNIFLTKIKIAVLTLIMNVLCIQLLAQNTNGIFFQAVARDNYANPAKDRKLYIQSSIIQNNATGTIVLVEEHQANTDASGVFNIILGNGLRIGGTSNGLTNIDWSKGPFFLNIKLAITPVGSNNTWDYRKEWLDMGTTSFGSVPYALYAEYVTGFDTKLNVLDSAKMLMPYAKNATVNALSANIDLELGAKLNLSDSIVKYITPTMLAAKTFDSSTIYNQLALKLNTIDANNALQLKSNITDVTNALMTKANLTDVTTELGLKEKLANKTIDVTADGASDTKYPSAKAVKTYVDASIIAGTTPLSFTSPLVKSGFTISLPQSNGSVNGFLSFTDWSSFNNKIDASQKGALNGLASLGNDGKIPSTQIPAISFQSASVVSSQAAMLAINGAVVGSIAIRTDNNKNYVLSASPSTTMTNWIELATPNSVTSVNGFAGPNIVLTSNDVSEGAANKYYTDARTRGALSATAPLIFNTNTGAFSISAASASIDGYLSAVDWNTFKNKQNVLIAGTDYVTPAQISLNNLGAEASANKSTATDLGNTSPSDVLYPSQKAVKTYVDLQSANAGVADNSLTSAKIYGTIAINKGGTGASTAADARTNLGLVIGTNVQAPLTAGTDYLTPTGSAANLINFPIFNQNTTGNAATASLATNAISANNITATSNNTLTALPNLVTVGTISTGTISLTTNIKTTNTLTAGAVTYPNTHGTANQILSTTGSGTLTWTTVSSTADAATLSGTITILKGGTGATTKTSAFDALSPMTTEGDIIYGGTNGTGTRLGKGSNGTLLTIENNIPSWTTSIKATPGSSYNAAVGFSFLGGDWARNTGMFSDNPDGGGSATLKFRIATSNSTADPYLEIRPTKVSVLPITASTSKTTGSLIVSGGVGVSGDIYASNLNISGAISGGTWSATTIDIAHGGTGATTATDALNNIGAAPINANLIDQTGTTYTLDASDNGKVVTLNNASAITLTVPAGLVAGFNCMIVQKGAGIVTIAPANTVTVTNRSGGTKTGGQNAIVSIISISSNFFITGGDMQ